MRRLTRFLRLGAILLIVFCVSSFFFYRRAKQKQNLAKQKQNLTKPKRDQSTLLFLTPAVLNQQLPKTALITFAGQKVDDEELRHGKLVLALMMPDCKPCNQENEFLKTVLNSRPDVPFRYIIPFGREDVLLKSAQGKYALEAAYDEGSNLSKTLEINEVPIEVFVVDGVIKRIWTEGNDTPEKQAKFKNWLRDL